jgi:L-amino acid N-acyltransferase YncA
MAMTTSANRTIRLARCEDADQVRDIYAPFCERTAISFETQTPTEEEMRKRIRMTLERLPWLVCVTNGDILGYAYAGLHRERAAYRWSADVSVYVRDGCHRSGIGRALYTILIETLNLLGYYNVFAGITLPNLASVGLHESLGFVPVGIYRDVGYKHGKWHDVGWWHLRLRSLSSSPDEPRRLEEVLETPEWPKAIAVGVSHLHPQRSVKVQLTTDRVFRTDT